MKRIIISFLILSSVEIMAQNNFEYLNELYVKRDFFRFSREVTTNRSNSWQLDYFRALYFNLVNNAHSSDSLISLLFKQDKPELNDSMKVTLLKASLNNAVNSYDYKKAYHINSEILNNYSSLCDSAEILEMKNAGLVWDAASSLPPQTCKFNSNSEVKTSRDMAGYMNIPVTVNEISSEFIFDTGANFSGIRKSHAEKLKLKFLKGEIKVGSMTGDNVNAELAYAEILSIGNMTFTNVLFLVFPDEVLTFAGGLYTINGIVGLPLIREMKEVHFRENSIYVPEFAVKKEINNLAMDGFNPVINVISGQDTLAFTFDSGARTTLLYKPYFEKFKAEITSKYQQVEIEVGGAAGIKKVRGYKLNNVVLNIAGSEAVLDSVDLADEILSDNSKYYYGNLGQDYMKQFDVMILNLESMYAEFIKK